MTPRLPLIAGSLLAGLAVALGAFGAHWLREALPRWGLEPAESSRRLEIWEVAVRYQMYHALALLALGWLQERFPAPGLWSAVTWLWIAGVLIFSGCLYALVVSGVKVLGAIVPIGGTALLIGWAVALYAILRK
jgi:uncharacterized membrane protein YgdD (TMEM256/DUF423 family)